MKKIILVIVLLVSINLNAQTKWALDASHSSINFSVSHLVISETTGSFDNFNIVGTAKENFESPVFYVQIETNSINTKNERRDNHLKSDDFFDVEKFPNIIFKTTSYKKINEKDFYVIGDITIKGITKEVMFTGKLNGVVSTKNGKKAGLKLQGKINREDFGIGVGSNSIGDEVTIIINLEMNQEK